MSKLSTFAALACVGLIPNLGSTAPGDANATFVGDLNALYQGVLPYSSNANEQKTNYTHNFNPWSDPGPVIWDGDNSKCFVDCSGLAIALLNHYDSEYDADFFSAWMTTVHPKATNFHDAIFSRYGFEQITSIEDAKAGDFIAVLYGKENDVDTRDTGHVMIMAADPQQITPQAPILPENSTQPATWEQWSVEVYDASTSAHGTSDARYVAPPGKNFEGLGRGTIRFYTDATGVIQLMTWSLAATTTQFPQGSPLKVDDFHIVIGRFDPSFTPISERTKLTLSELGSGSAAAYPGNFYFAGSTANIYATPDNGYAFVGWGEPINATTNPASIVMAEDQSVTAKFAPGAWAKGNDVGNGWLYYDWFGFAYFPGGNWLYSHNLGWVYSQGSDASSIFIYQNNLGWLWTSKSTVGNYYQFSTSDWLTYQSTSGNTATFINQATGQNLNITIVQ